MNDVYTKYCQRIIDFSYNEIDDYKSIIQAINHPVGNVTQALINIWFNGKPHDNEGIPDKLKAFLPSCVIPIISLSDIPELFWPQI